MRARAVLLSVALVAGSLVLTTGSAGAVGRATTTITIEGPNGDFHGEIRSVRECRGGRTVKVFKQLGAQPSPPDDLLIASDISERQGRVGVWSVGNTGYRRGRFYAKATRTTDCRSALSPTIRL
jgi:hypothetical protein